MKNKFILLELNQRNEIRADVNLTIKSLGITEIENINVKIDTGCPYTSIPVRKRNHNIRLAGYCHMTAIRQANGIK